MPFRLRKVFNRSNVLTLVGIVLVILSVLMVPGRSGVMAPIEMEINVDNPDEAPLWITVDLLPQEDSTIQIVFPERSGYSVLVNRIPKAVTSDHSSFQGNNTVPVVASGAGFWRFGQGTPSKGSRYSVKFRVNNFVAPTHTGYVGIWRLKAMSGTEEVSVFPALHASHHLTLSASVPAPIQIATGRRPFEGARMTPVEGFDNNDSREPQIYYIYEKVKGEFVSKWEFFDTKRARGRELWLIFWSSLLGLGIGFFLEGFVVQLGHEHKAYDCGCSKLRRPTQTGQR